jgi:hypothetical protein
VRKICPLCERRRSVGVCKFGGPNVVIPAHCRECCSAPDRDRWHAESAAARKDRGKVRRRA